MNSDPVKAERGEFKFSFAYSACAPWTDVRIK